MDKIKTTDCYVPVDVKERLPDSIGWYNCYAGDEFLGQAYFHDGKFSHKPVTHWLEKKEGVIVLTEAEYLADKTKTAEEAFFAGGEFLMESVKALLDGNKIVPVPNQTEYIKSLLP